MLTFALIGCGRIAGKHAEILSRLLPGEARLAAVCDIVEENARELGVKYQAPHFTDMHEMMSSVDVDVVVVLTESGNHARHTIEMANYGKAIIVEKPMALTLDDADAMIEACESYGCALFVVKQNRYNLPVTRLREAIDQRRFGRLLMGTVRVRWCRDQAYYDQADWRGTWELDGGVLANQASHHIDLLEWMMGEVDTVYAHGRRALNDIEAEDTAVAVLQFRNGALGIVEATTATRPHDLEGSLSILGETGTVEIGGFAVNEMKVWSFSEPQEEDNEMLDKYSVNPPDVYGFGHLAYYQDMIHSLMNHQKPLVDGREGRKSVELITAIYESIETGTETKYPFTAKHSRLGKPHG